MREIMYMYLDCLDKTNGIIPEKKIEKYKFVNKRLDDFFSKKYEEIKENEFYNSKILSEQKNTRVSQMFKYAHEQNDNFNETMINYENTIEKYYYSYMQKDTDLGNMFLELGFILNDFDCNEKDYEDRLIFYILFNRLITRLNKPKLKRLLVELLKEMSINIIDCFKLTTAIKTTLDDTYSTIFLGKGNEISSKMSNEDEIMKKIITSFLLASDGYLHR